MTHELTNSGSDRSQLANMAKKAKKVLGADQLDAVADSGCYNREEIGGDKFTASYVYPPLGVARRWETFSQIAKEIQDARVWAGFHFRTADDHGTLGGDGRLLVA